MSGDSAGDRPGRNRFITFADNYASEPSAGVSGNCLGADVRKKSVGAPRSSRRGDQ